MEVKGEQEHRSHEAAGRGSGSYFHTYSKVNPVCWQGSNIAMDAGWVKVSF